MTWKQLIVLAVLLLGSQVAIQTLWPGPSIAQFTNPPDYAVVLTTCGTGPSYTAGTFAPATQNVNGQLCNNQ